VKSPSRPLIIASVTVISLALVVFIRAVGVGVAGIVVAFAAWLFPTSASPDEPRESPNESTPVRTNRRSQAVLASPARYFLIIGMVLFLVGVSWLIDAHIDKRSSIYWDGNVNLSASGDFAVALDYRPPRLDKGSGPNDIVLNGGSRTILVAPGSNKVAIWRSSDIPGAEQCTTQLTAAGSSPKVEQQEIRAGYSICLFTRAGRLAVIHIYEISAATASAAMRGLSAEVSVYNVPSGKRY
jgi:hypothetical protein